MTPRPGDRAAALLGAFSFFLSAIDYLLPKPLPFMRLGLANLPLLLALDIFSPKNYCFLVLLKILGQALITGSLFSYVFLFSLSGSAASAALMFVLRRLFGNRISLAGTGIAGAFASNGVQLVLARCLVFGESVRYLAPPFLAAGIVSGAALGIFAGAFAAESKWLRTIKPDIQEISGVEFQAAGPPRSSLFRAALGFVSAAVFLALPRLELKAALFASFMCAAFFTGKKPRPVQLIVVMAGIAACNLFPPYGKVLFRAGPVTVALGSLLGGIGKAVNVEGLVMISKVITPGIALPGFFGRLLGESFRMLEELNARKGQLVKKSPNGKNFAKRLDEILMECYDKTRFGPIGGKDEVSSLQR